MTGRTPLYEAEHAARYEWQALILIREYQEAHGCRLVVMRDVVFPRCVPLFEETLFDADPDRDLHVLLGTTVLADYPILSARTPPGTQFIRTSRCGGQVIVDIPLVRSSAFGR